MCREGILKAESTCVAWLVELAAEPQHTQGRRAWRQGEAPCGIWIFLEETGRSLRDGQGVSHTQRLQPQWGPPSSPEGQANPASSPGLTAGRGPQGGACVYLTKEGKRISGRRLTCDDSLEMSVLAGDGRRLGCDER